MPLDSYAQVAEDELLEPRKLIGIEATRIIAILHHNSKTIHATNVREVIGLDPAAPRLIGLLGLGALRRVEGLRGPGGAIGRKWTEKVPYPYVLYVDSTLTGR
jgi:hypothetical protein